MIHRSLRLSLTTDLALRGALLLACLLVGSAADARLDTVVAPPGESILGAEVNVIGRIVTELTGGEFALNGVPFAGPTITLSGADVFTGTLADGSVFVSSLFAGDLLNGVPLTMVPLPTLDTTPRVVSTNISSEPSGLRAGQTLTLQSGGVLDDDFAAVDATLNVQGGVIGDGLETVGSEVNLSGGTVGDDFDAFSDSVINLLGVEFLLDGVLLENLTPGESLTIAERGGSFRHARR